MSCAAGERATGGGIRASNTHVEMIDSTPTTGGSPSATGATPNGWWANAKTDDGVPHIAYAVVVCAAP